MGEEKRSWKLKGDFLEKDMFTLEPRL
jgi:hypothetical protein